MEAMASLSLAKRHERQQALIAGIAAGRAAAARVPVNPADLVHDSIGACRTEIENAGVAIDLWHGRKPSPNGEGNRKAAELLRSGEVLKTFENHRAAALSEAKSLNS